MYPSDDDPTTSFPAVSPPSGSSGPMTPKRRLGRRATIAAVAVCGAVVVAAGVAIGLSRNDAGDHRAVGAAAPSALTSDPPGQGAGRHDKGDPARQSWARQYGQDRSAMPNLPDVASATPQQQSAAADLLARTEAATAGYTDINTAKTAGFDVAATLTRAEQKNPKLAQRVQQIDSGQTGAKMPILQVANKANRRDGRLLDPTAPEALTYAYTGHNTWKLIGVVYTAAESYPQAPPDPGGPVTRWQYHGKHGGVLTMPVFFAAGNDLAHAYALTMNAT